MGNFESSISTSGKTFVNSTTKALLASKSIPFTVHNVHGPDERTITVKGRSKQIEEYVLEIEIDLEDCTEHDLMPNMLLSFQAGYEGRDRRIKGLRDDIAQFGRVENVIVIGDDSFYNLSSLNVS